MKSKKTTYFSASSHELVRVAKPYVEEPGKTEAP